MNPASLNELDRSGAARRRRRLECNSKSAAEKNKEKKTPVHFEKRTADLVSFHSARPLFSGIVRHTVCLMVIDVCHLKNLPCSATERAEPLNQALSLYSFHVTFDECRLFGVLCCRFFFSTLTNERQLRKVVRRNFQETLVAISAAVAILKPSSLLDSIF